MSLLAWIEARGRVKYKST